MIKFDSNSGHLEIKGDPRTLAAESTFVIKEIWQTIFDKNPIAAEIFKMDVMSSVQLCFMTEARRKEELKKGAAMADILRQMLSKMDKKENEEEKKKPDVSADFMSDEEFHSFFDKLRGEDE